jgi:hypothetical protein
LLNFLRSVVFDRKRMPWFADEFEPPSEHWRPVLADILDDAMKPCAQAADAVRRED